MSNQKEILIIEEQELLLRLQSLLLKSRGYLVNGVTSSKVALDCMASKRPDLVVIDTMQAEMDAFEVCRRIKSAKATRDIPVIILSDRKSAADMARGEQAGADWYITKPFKSSLLVGAVEQLLAGAAKQELCCS